MTQATRRSRIAINWPTVSFIAATTLTALAWPIHGWLYGVSGGQLAIALFYFVASGLGITVGYHRLVSHRAFKCRPAVKVALLVAGAVAWQGSALEWGSDHVRHHAYIDTDGDPYNRQRGFWYSHIGWLLLREPRPAQAPPAFLTEDRLVMLQHRYYFPLAVFVGFGLPWLLGGAGGLLLAAVRTVVLHHMTWFINSWAHTGNYRPYRSNISAVDNWFLAFFTFGEGYHNYHHCFPSDYRNGVTAASWDPSKWLIWTLAKLGAAWDLNSTSPAVMWRRRVENALTFEGSIALREEMFQRTCTALESVARKTELRLSRLTARLPDVRLSAVAVEKSELQARLAAYVEEWSDGRHRRRLARARRAAEMLEHLSAYRDLLERLMSPYDSAPAAS